jgi:hypothetical protein
MTTQCEAIMARLKAGRTLTPADALNDFGCFRLAARVNDLRAQGHDILTIRESQGEKCFARYQLRTPSRG